MDQNLLNKFALWNNLKEGEEMQELSGGPGPWRVERTIRKEGNRLIFWNGLPPSLATGGNAPTDCYVFDKDRITRYDGLPGSFLTGPRVPLETIVFKKGMIREYDGWEGSMWAGPNPPRQTTVFRDDSVYVYDGVEPSWAAGFKAPREVYRFVRKKEPEPVNQGPSVDDLCHLVEARIERQRLNRAASNHRHKLRYDPNQDPTERLNQIFADYYSSPERANDQPLKFTETYRNAINFFRRLPSVISGKLEAFVEKYSK